MVPILSKLLPNLHEARLIRLEQCNHVILWQIVLLKLLDDNQNEQIEHYMCANDNNQHKVNI